MALSQRYTLMGADIQDYAKCRLIYSYTADSKVGLFEVSC
jgi:hypothetical protein